MNKEKDERRPKWSVVIWMVVLGFFAGFIYSVLIIYVTPKQYVSSTQIEFREPLNPGIGENWSVANETAFLTSPKVHQEVSRRMLSSSRSKIDVDESVLAQILEGISSVEPVGSSDIQLLEVLHPSALEARDIARTYPLAYSALKLKERAERMDANLASLDLQIEQQQDLIQESEKKLRDLLKKAGAEAAIANFPKENSLKALYENRLKIDDDLMKMYQEEWWSYSLESSALDTLADQRSEIILRKAEVYEPINILEEAEKPMSATYPVIGWELFWGALRGLIVGIVFGISTLIFHRIKGGECPGKRATDPADVW